MTTELNTRKPIVLSTDGAVRRMRDGSAMTRPLRITAAGKPAVVVAGEIHIVDVIDPKTVQLTSRTVKDARVATKADVGQLTKAEREAAKAAEEAEKAAALTKKTTRRTTRKTTRKAEPKATTKQAKPASSARKKSDAGDIAELLAKLPPELLTALAKVAQS